MADARALRFAARHRHHMMPDPDRAALAAQNHHIRYRYRSFLCRNSAGNLLCRVLFGVPLDHVNVLDENPSVRRINSKHTARLAFVAPGNHLHLIVLAELDADGFAFIFLERLRHLDNLRRERHDLHEFLFPELARHRSENARSHRFAHIAVSYTHLTLPTIYS